MVGVTQLQLPYTMKKKNPWAKIRLAETGRQCFNFCFAFIIAIFEISITLYHHNAGWTFCTAGSSKILKQKKHMHRKRLHDEKENHNYYTRWQYKLYTVESVFFVQNFVWKNYQLLLVESTSNFAWSLFWRKFTSRVIYFCQIFSASKIFVKLLFIGAGLDVFPFKMMKKEPCHRVQHVKISRNWSSSFVGRLCACLKNQMFERQWKMCSTGLNACNLGYGGQRTWISHHAGKFLWKSAHQQDECAADVTN